MPGMTITLPTALTVYRLSTVLVAAEVGGVSELGLQPSKRNASGTLFVGGSAVSPTNCGLELEPTESNRSDSGGGNRIITTDDYVTSDVDNFLVNVYWRTQ
jgi:hypothetical protein